MTKEQVLGLAVRLFAIFLFVYGLRSLTGVIQLAETASGYSGIWWVAVSYLVIFVCIALMLWFFPVTVARKILPKDDRKTGETEISLKDIDVVAYSILGVWLLATTIPDVIYWLLVLATLEHKGLIPYMTHSRLASVIATIIQFGIGIWLMLGAKGLRGLIRKLRYAGS
jgi:hypothetical protein